MLFKKRILGFGEFSLDTEREILWRDGKTVPLTPKALHLLLVLVENQGRVMDKKELMETVWADSFVEESNLTFTISILRKGLNGGQKEAVFIETVPKKGYRFVAEVTEISASTEGSKNGLSPNIIQSADKYIEQPAAGKARSLLSLALISVCLLILGGVVLGFWYFGSRRSNFLVLDAPFASEKLSTDGKVFNAVISPDGKNVVYTSGSGNDKQSMWLRQLDTGNNVEIIPPSNVVYSGLTFSPDGTFIYFNRRSPFEEESADLFRISIFGGVPVKIVSGTYGSLNISPDGGKIIFRRCSFKKEEHCALFLVDAADGKNERKLISSSGEDRIGAAAFAPDGKSIVYGVGQSLNAANEFGLVEIDLESGAEHKFTKEKFFDIRNVKWLPDKSALLITASKIPNKNFRIWQIPTATGEAVPLTKDSESYFGLSLDNDLTSIVSTQVKSDYQLKTLQMDNLLATSQTLSAAMTVSFAPNGKIFFSSSMSGNDEIWRSNADGTERRQLTSNQADESVPIASPDNSAVFFASNRTGEVHVWRMDFDGSNQTQITNKEGGFPIFVSPDGKWVYYHHGVRRNLWRVSANGEQVEQPIFNKPNQFFAISPDGSQVAFPENQGQDNFIKVVSLTNEAQVIKTFRLKDGSIIKLNRLGWMPGGKNLAYIITDTESKNRFLCLQPLEKTTPKQIISMGSEGVFFFAFSPDEKTLAFVQGNWQHDAVLLKGLK